MWVLDSLGPKALKACPSGPNGLGEGGTVTGRFDTLDKAINPNPANNCSAHEYVMKTLRHATNMKQSM